MRTTGPGDLTFTEGLFKSFGGNALDSKLFLLVRVVNEASLLSEWAPLESPKSSRCSMLECGASAIALPIGRGEN